jgi:hypothetical protein
MFSQRDVRYVAELHYDIYTDFGRYEYPHDKFVGLVVEIIETFELLENIEKKKEELALLVGD